MKDAIPAGVMKIETAARLKLARLAIQAAHGLTHNEFCKAIGITHQALSNYEVGRNWVPLALLARIKRRFGLPTDYVITGSLEGIPRIVTKEIARIEGND